MPESMVALESSGLSQIERVVDTFVAPSKTFHDVLRSTNWWLPFLIAMFAAIGSAYAVDQKIGFDNVAEMSIQQSPTSEEQMAKLEPGARAHQMHIIAASMRYASYASGALILLFTTVFALINWASFNFVLGARTTFGQNFAVCLYASLPRVFLSLLNIVLVYAGVNTDNFDLNNPVGTNVGYYLADAPHWAKTALSFFDVFGLWTLALMVIGMAIVSGKTKSQSAAIVVGWWLLGMVVLTGMAFVRG
jgi:hypothetical protein